MARVVRQDLRLFAVTFATIFIAELGDKTQLATLGFAVNTPEHRLLILAAAATALVASSLMGTLLGTLLARWIKPRIMNLVAGLIFIACAAVFAWQFFAMGGTGGEPSAEGQGAAAALAEAGQSAPWELFIATFFALFIAELGDKTQLATFSLAAGNRHARWMVFGGSAAALVLSTVLAVSVGAVLGKYIDQRWLTLAAAIVFCVLGIVFLLGRAEKGKREFGWLVEEIERVYVENKCRACPDFMEFLIHIRDLGSETVNARVEPLILPREQWDEQCSGSCRIDHLHARLHEDQGEPPPGPWRDGGKSQGGAGR